MRGTGNKPQGRSQLSVCSTGQRKNNTKRQTKEYQKKMKETKKKTRVISKIFLVVAFLMVFLSGSQIAWGKSSKLILPPGEQAWLKEHPVIRLGFSTPQKPIVFIGPDGSQVGFLIDFVQ